MRLAALAAALLAALPVLAAPLDPAALDLGADLAYRRALQPAAAERRLNADRALALRVRQIVNRLVAGAPAIDPNAQSAAWTVNVVTDPVPEALAFPGARLLVHSGLLVNAGLSDEDVAAVLAHVVAHTLLGHDRVRLQATVPASAATAADPNARALAIAQAATEGVKRRPSAAEIAAADQASVELLARGVYDPRGAAAAWRRLAATRNPLVERLPVDESRLAALEAAGQERLALYQATATKAAEMQQRASPPLPGSARGVR